MNSIIKLNRCCCLNARDVASVLVYLDAGYPAIGTTSCGVVASQGKPDAGRITREANLALVRAIAGVTAHISVDIEDGYADDPEQVADYFAELAEAGAVGINIEDGSQETLIEPTAHAAKIVAIKRRAPTMFVNARVNTYSALAESSYSNHAIFPTGRHRFPLRRYCRSGVEHGLCSVSAARRVHGGLLDRAS
jgi:2-methylisocitrate lyase-like PEP mutase family enzyme